MRKFLASLLAVFVGVMPVVGGACAEGLAFDTIVLLFTLKTKDVLSDTTLT